jgi:hypothetical protein
VIENDGENIFFEKGGMKILWRDGKSRKRRYRK